jgi:uncharacterized DUF497 family protein
MGFEYDPEKSAENKLEHGVDFPGWMVDSLDREARRIGVTRQSLIKA